MESPFTRIGRLAIKDQIVSILDFVGQLSSLSYTLVSLSLLFLNAHSWPEALQK